MLFTQNKSGINQIMPFSARTKFGQISDTADICECTYEMEINTPYTYPLYVAGTEVLDLAIH